MTFHLECQTENDAFSGGNSQKLHEVARILVEAAKMLRNGNESGKLRDENGNMVGQFYFR